MLFQDGASEVRRSFPHGYLDVYSLGAGRPERWDLPLQLRKNSYVLLVLADAASLFLVTYDVVANVPSGRSTQTVRNGFDVHRLSRTDRKIKLMAQAVPLGGVDTLIHGTVDGGNVHLCGGARCFTVTEGGAREWNARVLSGKDIIELKFDGARAAAILRPAHDDRTGGALSRAGTAYQLAQFDQREGSASRIDEADGIPWDLRWASGRPTHSMARTRGDYQRILAFDFNRMPFRGGVDFGNNNLEGRVVWSQFYYLSGLLSVAEGKLGGLDSLRQTARARACAEIRLVAELGTTDAPGYAAKRYALDREALLSALHLGRIAEILKRAIELGCVLPSATATRLKADLQRLDRTLEVRHVFTYGGKRWQYLGIRKGSPFWADGANVPYNYVSGYVRGLWALDPSDEATEWGRELLGPLLEYELSRPDVQLWRYWWGMGDDGWTEEQGVSLNTPAYSGNKGGLAHVSYRTMDASAVLALGRRVPDERVRRLATLFRALVADGWLNPSLNHDLAASGRRARLQPSVARHHARAASWAEIDSQVWALDQLSVGGER